MSQTAKELLHAEYASHLPDHAVAAPRSPVAAPSPELVDQIENEAVAAGVPAGSVDWAAITQIIITAVTTKNPLAWLQLITVLGPLAPGAFMAAMKFIGQLFASFKKQPPAPAPTINPA